MAQSAAVQPYNSTVLAALRHGEEECRANLVNLPDQRRVVDAMPPDRYRRAPASQTTNLADLLERVLDKGIVIAGDITLAFGEVEVLNIKVRLLVASIDKAQEIGIDWWRSDPALSSRTRVGQLEQENQLLKERLERLEERLSGLSQLPPNNPSDDNMGS